MCIESQHLLPPQLPIHQHHGLCLLPTPPTSQRLANQHLLPPQLAIQQHHGFVQPPPLPVSVAQQLVPHSTVPVIPSAPRNQAVLLSQDHVLMLRLSQLVGGVVILLGQPVCREARVLGSQPSVHRRFSIAGLQRKG